MKTKWLIIAAFLPLYSLCQTKKNCGCLQGLISAGVVGGQSAAKPLLQAGAGFGQDAYYAGLGMGFDHYFLRSIPVFAEGRYQLLKGTPVFVYGQLGYNIPYNNHNDIDMIPASVTNHYRGGFYMDAGVGYWLLLARKQRIGISAGYSRKDLSNRQVSSFCVIAPCSQSASEFRYSLGRMLAKLSWSWGHSAKH